MSGRAQAETALRRVEALVATLGSLPETHARTIARELMEAVLDLHGAALARTAAIVAASGCGEAVFAAMAGDPQVAAVLLLHGLHPELPEARVRRALGRIAPELRRQGAEAALAEVRDGVARVRLRLPGASREQAAMARRELEAVLVEAAPDLDEIAILIEAGDVQPVA